MLSANPKFACTGERIIQKTPLIWAGGNRPRSIYQYSSMAPRLSGQTSIFGVVFFLSKSLLGIEGQKKLEKFAILTRKPRSHAWIVAYSTRLFTNPLTTSPLAFTASLPKQKHSRTKSGQLRRLSPMSPISLNKMDFSQYFLLDLLWLKVFQSWVIFHDHRKGQASMLGITYYSKLSHH